MRVETINVLHLEDSELDAQLIQHTLSVEQYMFAITWVNNFQDYLKALRKKPFDLILADYSLPDCDGLKAFYEAHAIDENAPFILITGALGEERAIEMIKAGVTDYVLKTNLLRLNLTIPRALEDARASLKSRENSEALRLSEERFDLAVRGSGAGIWDWGDLSQDKMWWSPRIFEILEYSEGEIPATRSQLYKIIHEDDVARVKAHMDAHIAQQARYDIEYRIMAKTGHPVWIRSRGQAVFSAGVATRMAGYLQDISDRKQAQEALQARQRDLLQAQEVANIGFWTYTIKTAQLFWTPVVYRIYGLDPEQTQIDKATAMSRVHPEDLLRVEKTWDNIIFNGQMDYEHRLMVDDQVRWVHQIAKVEYAENGAPIKILGIVHDLTSQRSAEEERRKADERYRKITDSAHDSIIMIDQSGTVVFWNPASERIFGYSEEEVIGKDLHQLFFAGNDTNEKCLCRYLKQAYAKRDSDATVQNELSVVTKSGSKIQVEMNASSIVQAEHWFGLGIIRDVTERRQLEGQLLQTQKMEAIGTLAGGIAHDFNNILASVLGYSSMAERRLADGSREKEDLRQVINAAERAKQLVRQILTVSRKSEIEKAPVYLDLVIKEVLRLIRASLPATIEVKVDLQPESGATLGDVTQVHQILMNLCTNAYHAMPDGGQLTISLKKVLLPGSERLPLKDGTYLELRVSDTGKGIEPDILDLIFDPYFTTKDVDTGTGLGLSVVSGIIDSMDGYIDVDSSLGLGTCFRVLLPSCTAKAEDPHTAEIQVMKGQGQHILVVDDEVPLAQLEQQLLKELGYQATIKTDSQAALEEIEAHPQKYDLLLTDQTMPKMTGFELARRVYKINADLPVILCSGSTLAMDSETMKNTAICQVALKTDLLDNLPVILGEVFKNG